MENFELFGIYFSKEGKKGVMLNWIFSSDNIGFEEFIIEKSLDNKEFKVIGTENKYREAQRDFFYLFIDEEFNYGKNYYRLILKKSKSSKKITAMSNTITVKVVDEKLQIETKERDLSRAELVF